MPVTIGSNIASLKTQRQLAKVTDSVATVSSRLASGQRINSASDDAAGLSVASSLNARGRVLNRAMLNAQDGLSMLSIADGALGQLTSITDRLRELAESSANGIYSDKQRNALDKEAKQLVSEYNRIVDTTTFNGMQILQADSSTTLMLGFGDESMLTIDFAKALAYSGPSGVWTEDSQNLFSDFRRVLADDFNNDGTMDLFVGSSSGSSRIYLGNGDGTFKNPTTISVGVVNATSADMDQDGNMDLVISTPTALRIYKGNGDGTFKAPISYGFINSSLAPLVATDLNHDGYLDIVEVDGNTGGSTVGVFLGNSDGTLNAPTSFMTGASNSSGNSLFAFDMNNDGNADILHGIVGGPNYIALGNGDGTFAAPVTLSGSRIMAYGDINNDGITDFINLAGIGYLGNGDGTFRQVSVLPATSLSDISKLVDLNQDGNLDVIIG